MSQRYRQRDVSTGAALSVVLGTGDAAQPFIEIFMNQLQVQHI